MRRIASIGALWSLWLLIGLAPTGAQAQLEEALGQIEARDWQAATNAARRDGKIAEMIVEWHRLRAGEGSFPDYLAFLQAHPDWPGLPLLRRKGEDTIPADAAPTQVLAFFGTSTPQTGYGVQRLAAALEAQGRAKEARAVVLKAWASLPMTADDESTLLAIYGKTLAGHHVGRMDTLLWDHQLTAAARMRELVPADYRRLLDARLALAGDKPGVDSFIAAVPPALAEDPGLARERADWRRRKGRTDEEAALMLERSASAKTLGRPEKWAGRRRSLVRQLMRDGQSRDAYALAAQHRLTAGDDYADLEWLAGYIALTQLNDPTTALTHFKQFRAAVGSPISLGRAGYWEGRAYEAQGNPVAASAAYNFGAEFQTSFYGQLAAKRAGIAMDPALTGTETFPDAGRATFTTSTVYRAGLALQKAGDLTQSARFLSHLAQGLDRTQIGQLATATEGLHAPYIQLQLAKQAASRGVILPRAYFPLMPVSTRDRPGVSPELALAIARRESEFNPGVISPVGARGLMQVMPGTASDTAKALGIDYSLPRLTEDPTYNALLGTAYLQKLTAEFGGSVALVAAGYNAGPGRPRRWLSDYGDPREAEVDVVDWIEHLPLEETRNYIMRVSESLDPYRARLTGKTVPLTLIERLKAR